MGLSPLSLSAALTNNMHGFRERFKKYFGISPSLKLSGAKLRKIIITNEKMQQEEEGRGWFWRNVALEIEIENHCRKYEAGELACQRIQLIRLARSVIRCRSFPKLSLRAAVTTVIGRGTTVGLCRRQTATSATPSLSVSSSPLSLPPPSSLAYPSPSTSRFHHAGD